MQGVTVAILVLVGVGVAAAIAYRQHQQKQKPANRINRIDRKHSFSLNMTDDPASAATFNQPGNSDLDRDLKQEAHSTNTDPPGDSNVDAGLATDTTSTGSDEIYNPSSMWFTANTNSDMPATIYHEMGEMKGIHPDSLSFRKASSTNTNTEDDELYGASMSVGAVKERLASIKRPSIFGPTVKQASSASAAEQAVSQFSTVGCATLQPCALSCNRVLYLATVCSILQPCALSCNRAGGQPVQHGWVRHLWPTIFNC